MATEHLARRHLGATHDAAGTTTLIASDDGDAWQSTGVTWGSAGSSALVTTPAGAVWAASHDADGVVWLRELSADAPEPHAIEGATTPHPPALAWWHGSLVVAITAADGHLYIARGSHPAEMAFRLADELALAHEEPTLAGTPSRLFLAFRGTDRALYLAASDDGVEFPIGPLGERKLRAAPRLCSWGPAIALAAADLRGHVLVASSLRGPKLSLEVVGGGAITHESPAVAMDDGGLIVMLVGTDGNTWLARGTPDTLAFAPVEGLPAPAAPLSLAIHRQGEPAGPSRTVVRPLLFLPSGVDRDEATLGALQDEIEKHLAVAQERYRGWLVTDTFEYARAEVVRGARAHLDYKRGDAWTDIYQEVCAAQGDCDVTSTSVYVTLLVRPPGFEDQLWLGAGGPGSCEGGGMVLMDARCIVEDQPYPFQSTLVHELGHAFGLPHVDAWGEDMETCASVMSYNPHHRTQGPSIPEAHQGFLPEEFAILGKNEVAFPDFEYDPALHDPSGRPLRPSRE